MEGILKADFLGSINIPAPCQASVDRDHIGRLDFIQFCEINLIILFSFKGDRFFQFDNKIGLCLCRQCVLRQVLFILFHYDLLSLTLLPDFRKQVFSIYLIDAVQLVQLKHHHATDLRKQVRHFNRD